MAFNDVFIIFAILLFLMIVMSTLGGSVRLHERYEDIPTQPKEASASVEPSKEPSNETPHVTCTSESCSKDDTVVEAFDGEAYAGFEDGAEKAADE
jgi:hypothetical protein